jgi:hypothetical protein
MLKEEKMTGTMTESMEHIGETHGIANHDHDLVQELSKRLDGLWRFDQYIANADGKAELQAVWRDLKKQDRQNVDRLKQMIRTEIECGCF